jgi:Domain of unknown function (DUF4338)/DDE_Tnp_1-associated/Transposase DDE domain
VQPRTSSRSVTDTDSVRFGGRVVTAVEIRRIVALIHARPALGRTDLSRAVCREFRWRRANGELRTRACLDLLVRLEGLGLIQLPKPRVSAPRVPRRCPSLSAAVPGDSSHEIVTELALRRVLVRPVEPAEVPQWRALMASHHYLGDVEIVGESLRHVAEIDGRWLALLGWGAAALKSRHREAWIGWDESTKLQRLMFISDNVRFLILPWIQVKGLASTVLSRSVRRLSGDFESKYRHKILLAETFVDHSKFKGTCYRAANWICLGETRGMRRKGRGFEDHGVKKTLFVYPLSPRTRDLLAAPMASPEIARTSAMNAAFVDVSRLPIAGEGGLIDLLRSIEDPRNRQGIRHPYSSVLVLSVMAALSGMRSYEAIAEWARDLPKDLLKGLKCWCHKAPSEPTFRRVLQNANAELIDKIVGQWLAALVERKAISIDGKTLRGSKSGATLPRHLLAAITHDDGVVVAQEQVDQKSNEITAAKPLLAKLDLADSVVTADAMHTQKDLARFLVEDKKADYVFIAKENQPTLLADIQAVDWESIPPSGPNDRQGARPNRSADDQAES